MVVIFYGKISTPGKNTIILGATTTKNKNNIAVAIKER
jgi:hypothetical protein